MSKRLLAWISVFVISAVAGIFVYNWIKKSSEENVLELARKKTANSIASMDIKGFKMEQTDGNKLEWVLNADHAEMFKDQGYILFKIVNADIFGGDPGNANKDVYKLTSQRGTYYMKPDTITLTDDVNIRTSEGYAFNTSSVSYNARTKRVSSDSLMKAYGTSSKGSKLVMQGGGIRGYVGSGEFFINRNVDTKFGDNLEVKSDAAIINTRNKSVIFENKISALKDRLDIRGDSLTVQYDDGGNIGDIVVNNGVSLKIDDRHALCEKAVIVSDSNQVVLTGKPEFHSGDDIIVGEKIVFYTDNDEVYVSKVKADISGGAMRKKK
ncbi:MAG: LPS export ABC transporter periplasmic protein LptC [Pseudomonadota bacterium]